MASPDTHSRALQRARATVFSLDVTLSADHHAIRVRLTRGRGESLARKTFVE